MWLRITGLYLKNVYSVVKVHWPEDLVTTQLLRVEFYRRKGGLPWAQWAYFIGLVGLLLQILCNQRQLRDNRKDLGPCHFTVNAFSGQQVIGTDL